jgi:hypothetical protein
MRALGGLYEMFAAGDEADVIFGRAWTLFFDDDSALLKLIEKGKAEIERSFNGFSWEAHYEYYKDEKSPPLLTLHSRNYFSQDSPFDHTDELAEGLLRILDEAEKKRPDLKDVQCASWLNNLPPFQALFPAGWREKAVACPVEGHTGCWGQLIDRTGEINRKNLARLNTCGELQYMNLHCKCAVSALRRHLTAELREAQRV